MWCEILKIEYKNDYPDYDGKWNKTLDRGWFGDKNGAPYPYPYKVLVESDLTIQPEHTAMKWCGENCIGKFHRDRNNSEPRGFTTLDSISFELEEDAILFKMVYT